MERLGLRGKQKLLNLTAQQEAYLHLQDQIITGAIQAGSRIIPDRIAQTLGLSRMPVREAIRQLHAEGFVTIRPNRSAIVTPRSPEQLVEIIEIRAALEGLAGRLAIPFVTDDILEELQAKADALKVHTLDPFNLIERHDEFHDYICSICRRPRLSHELRELRLSERPYLRNFSKTNLTIERKGYEHGRLIDALRLRDADLADQLMREHVMINLYDFPSEFYPRSNKE